MYAPLCFRQIIRFRYYYSSIEFFLELDNIRVSLTSNKLGVMEAIVPLILCLNSGKSWEGKGRNIDAIFYEVPKEKKNKWLQRILSLQHSNTALCWGLAITILRMWHCKQANSKTVFKREYCFTIHNRTIKF